MSDQSSTTTNTQPESSLCTKGCGFFGNPATGNYCSKCWREEQKKNKGNECENETTAASSPTPMEICTPASPAVQKPAEAAVVEAQSQSKPQSSPSVREMASAMTMAAPSAAPKVVKKKKKKTSYKAMMANMTKRTKDEQDIEKEKEGLRKVTGGGAFAKIDKI